MSWQPLAPEYIAREGGPGVYLIACANGAVYVGSSIDVARRLREHLGELQRGKHNNSRLQRTWTKHGPQSFVFRVIATPAVDRLTWAEQLFIDAAFAIGDCFNGNRCASAYRPPTTPIAEKLATVTEEEWRTLSDVEIGKRYGASGESVRRRRPAHIPSPGTSSEYLSAKTKEGHARTGYDPRRNEKLAAHRERQKQEAAERRVQKAAPTPVDPAEVWADHLAAVRTQPDLKCAGRDCDVAWCSLLIEQEGRPRYCTPTCKWREQARRQATRRAAYKRRRRAEAGLPAPQRVMSEEQKVRISAAQRGRRLTEEHKQKLAEAARRRAI